jgi:integrase
MTWTTRVIAVARTVRDVTLSTRAARQKLAISGKPYYRTIDHGLHLGYRKGARAGKWVVRYYAGEERYHVETIGTADDVADADGVRILSFSQAQEIARTKATDRARAAKGLPAASAGPYTVADALDDYVSFLEHERKSGADARNRADELIKPVLGPTAAADLTTEQIRKWLRDLAAKPPRLRTKKPAEGGGAPKQRYREIDKDDDETKRRRRASANRTLTTLKAALNYAWREKKIASDDAWRRVEPFENVDAARLRYLTVAEAQRLINACDPDFRRLVQAALQTGARYGELCRLDVRDLNPEAGTLHIRKSKGGKPRHIVLTEEGLELFKSFALGRAGGDPMLEKIRLVPQKPIDGIAQPEKVIRSRWGESHQSRPLAAASKRAKIDPPIDFHSLRHTYASLSVMAGVPLMVVAKQLGHADTRMVEKHYGHLAPSYIADAVRSMAPRFGVIKDDNVVGLEKVR